MAFGTKLPKTLEILVYRIRLELPDRILFFANDMETVEIVATNVLKYRAFTEGLASCLRLRPFLPLYGAIKLVVFPLPRSLPLKGQEQTLQASLRLADAGTLLLSLDMVSLTTPKPG